MLYNILIKRACVALVLFAEISPFILTNYLIHIFPFILSYQGRGIFLLLISFLLVFSDSFLSPVSCPLLIFSALIEFVREVFEFKFNDSNDYFNSNSNSNSLRNSNISNISGTIELEEKEMR